MGLNEKLMLLFGKALLVSSSVAAIAKFAIPRMQYCKTAVCQLFSNFWRKGIEAQLRRAWVYHSTNDANE